MNEQTSPAVGGPVDAPVGPLARMTVSEEAWMLRNPYALKLLMDYQDQQHTEYEAVCDDDERRPWPTRRWTALYERGRSIMSEDLELWDADLLRAFGFPERPNSALDNPCKV
jgi:hypothetical protein